MRTYRFQFTVQCVNDQGRADLARAEEMIDLVMQELVYDDEFVTALGEDTAVTIQVEQIGGTNG
jgi:hypothetical protein